MNEREKNRLFKDLTDPEIELPSNPEQTLDEEQYLKIKMDRILDKKLSSNLPYRSELRTNDADFKKSLLEKIASTDRSKKVPGDTVRNTLIYLREKLIYKESASLQWSGMAAAMLVILSIPFLMTVNNNMYFTFNYEEGAGVSSMNPSTEETSREDFDGKSVITNGFVSAEKHSAPQVHPEADSSGIRSRSFNMEISDVDVLSDDEEVIVKTEKNTDEIKTREEKLLSGLKASKTDQERLHYLKELEKLYTESDEKELLRATREKIKSLE